MSRVGSDICIDVDPPTAFEYIDVPEHQAEITPSLSSIETAEELPTGGKRATYHWMAGVGLDGEVEAVAHGTPERIVFEVTGGIEGTIEWTFEAEGNGVRVGCAADYGLPVPVIGRLAAPFVRAYDERVLEMTLENLKTRLEPA